MRSWVLWRRSATAVGVYGAAFIGILATVVAERELDPASFGRFAIVLAAAGFFQLLMDLTVDEALVKFGFGYVARGRWGRLRRLLRVGLATKLVGGAAGTVALLVLAPIWGGALLVPLLVSSALPMLQAPEGIAAVAMILRSRTDLRAAFLMVSMALRLTGIGIGAHYGVTQAVLGMVVAQVLATAAASAGGALAFRRFPREPVEPLAEDTRSFWRFVATSSVGSGLLSVRGSLTTIIVGAVSTAAQTGYYRVAQAPLAGLASLSAPARLILLAEQTRDYESGDRRRFYGLLRRYVVGTSLLMLVAVPPLWYWMPTLIRVVYKAKALPATDAARLILLAAALQFVWGWTKSFPVSIGRPKLRIIAHSIEIVVLMPLLLVFAAKWGATGAAAAVLASTAAFCAWWTVMLFRIRREPLVPALARP